MYCLHNVLNLQLRLTFYAVFILVLLGCAGVQIKDIETPTAGNTIVFGSIEVIEDGKRKKCGKLLGLDNKCTLMILYPDSTQAANYGITENGSFAWDLQPGEYTIAGYHLLEGDISGRIWLHFTVPKDANSLYVGDIRLLIEKSMYKVGIMDNYEIATEKHQTKFPAAVDSPQKGIIKPDPGVGSFDAVKYICADGWGIECTKKFRGVTPLQPEVHTAGFTTVGSLTPTFEWQASSEESVTYDLAIYDAFTYSRDGIVTKYLPGGITVYKEGLKYPTWQLNSPLKPDNKYYWSVRLRRDGVVSSWSRYSYFAFYLVAWSSGYGQWFSFSTPAAR